MVYKFIDFVRKYRIEREVKRFKHLFKYTQLEGFKRPCLEDNKHNLSIVRHIIDDRTKQFNKEVVPMTEFCMRYKLPQHRFSRWQDKFDLVKVGKFKKPWVKINEHNNKVVAELLETYGTRPKKARLTFDEYQHKYGIDLTRLSDVFHRLDLEERNGRLLIADTKKNYALLTQQRPI